MLQGMARRRQTKKKDRFGIAMLLGALAGFAIGAVAGLSSTALDAPVLMPFAGAAIGVLVAAVVVGVLSAGAARERAAAQAGGGGRANAWLRHASHDGGTDGIALTGETRPRPRSTPRR